MISLVVACAIAAGPAEASSTEVSLQMDDGVALAGTLSLPDANAGGWLARGDALTSSAGRERAWPDRGELPRQPGLRPRLRRARPRRLRRLVTLDGPREMADLRAAFKWLTARTDVSDTQIGAMGISLGGGAVLRAAVEVVPFKAIVPTTTWTDLYARFFRRAGRRPVPSQFPPVGAHLGPDRLRVGAGCDPQPEHPAVQAFAAQRSSLPALAGLTTPTFFIQGRRDYAFDIAQAKAGYRAVKGPKRLYLGNLGHAPASNPAAEKPHYLTEVREWFDRYLKGLPNGIDTRPPIEVAADPGPARPRASRPSRRRRC